VQKDIKQFETVFVKCTNKNCLH